MALKFNTLSAASWIPGPPTSGEKLRQLKVYLGVVWQDLTEQVDWDAVVKTLMDEIAVHYPVVRRRIELFSLPDQLISEGQWEFLR